MTDSQWSPDGPNLIIAGDNSDVISRLPDNSFRVIYIDPPFNTGRAQTRQTTKTIRSDNASRVGFKGQTYQTVKGTISSYDDVFDDYWAFLEPRLESRLPCAVIGHFPGLFFQKFPGRSELLCQGLEPALHPGHFPGPELKTVFDEPGLTGPLIGIL